MADTELLPCPFCGGSDAFVERLDCTAAYVQCDADIGDGCSCQARGPIAVQDDDGEEIPGGAGAIAAWNRRAALASRPAEVAHQIPRESNDALIALARYWKLNGDWMTCKGCRRSLIASRDGEDLAHGDGCKYWDQQHPWAQLRKLITRRPAPAGAAQ
jgi:hypothetical protein